MHGALGVRFFHHHGDVGVRGRERDHDHVHVGQGVEDAAGQAGVAEEAAPHQAHDGGLAQDPHLAQAREVGLDLRQVFDGVDGHRDGHLGGRDQVDGRVVPLEDLEDLAQEAGGHQHLRLRDEHDRDAFAARHRTRAGGSQIRGGGDERARRVGLARVADADRDVPLDRGTDHGRVQQLAAEVGELGRFFR